MAEPAPSPKKPAGPMKYILIGCGVLTGLFILGMGGCAGVMYFIYKGTEPVAAVGADYLGKAPEVRAAFGNPVTVKRHKMGWNVQVVNDGGNARISYDVQGPELSNPREAVVWLQRSGGTWSAVGARVQGKDGATITVGKPPEGHSIWDD